MVLACLLFPVTGCRNREPAAAAAEAVMQRDTPVQPLYLYTYVVPREIRVREYFRFINSVVESFDSLTPYELDEYLLVRANPWLIDTLAATDYNMRQERGEFVFNQKELVVLRPGDSLGIPSESLAARIRERQAGTVLDINIPEFRLRIVENGDTLRSVRVRVGKNTKKYLTVLNRKQDLRTRTGTGQIIRVNRYPDWRDPASGKILKLTKRDDKRKTKLPQIPWLEPEIDGKRYGQMIHPTTNPNTLGRPASNGCIGCSEADAWHIYYAAPIGTPVIIRYDLDVLTVQGDTLHLRDIYR